MVGSGGEGVLPQLGYLLGGEKNKPFNTSSEYLEIGSRNAPGARGQRLPQRLCSARFTDACVTL